MQSPARKVVGFQVNSNPGSRTVRLDLHFDEGEVVNVELSLPTATRLTDHLVDVEFRERFHPSGLV